MQEKITLLIKSLTMVIDILSVDLLFSHVSAYGGDGMHNMPLAPMYHQPHTTLTSFRSPRSEILFTQYH
jgi:hypothetical protein